MLRVIGRGAYGEIWLARTLTGAWRAVKVVYRSTFENERAFEREFQGMSSFEPISRAHDGFVDILHVGQTSEYLYYTMELADDCIRSRDIDPGKYEPHTLKSELGRRFSANETIQLGLSLTRALEALHARGFAHRDIKPANIIFIDGVAKLADIGLVAITGQQSFVGTEGYVPPEGPGTARADIYSLGKVLYESCSGKDRLDFPELDSHLSERADSHEFLRLNEVLLKACANEPRRRYSSAAEMQSDLEKISGGKVQVKRRWPLPAAILLVLAFIILVFVSRRPTPNLDGHFQTAIQTDPPGAMVALDDHIKHSPATFDDLDARPYHLRIMSPGYDPIETTIDPSRIHTTSLFRLTRSKGALAIDANIPDARFTIRSNDGQITRDGSLPATLNDLPTGKYKIIALRGDWQMQENAEVQRDRTTQKSFIFASATLNLTSEPSGATVSLDGENRGQTPIRIEVAAREHEVIARLESWPEQKRKISLAAHEVQNANFVFANGSVKITSAPGGARVLSDGRELGQTPLVIEEVKPGTVRYELQAAGYKTAIVGGNVEPQHQTFLAQRLERALGPVANESWANSLGMTFVPLGNVRIAVWETRVQDYDAFCRATARGQVVLDFKQTPTDPAVKVNWFDAVAFCKWLTEKEHDENFIEPAQFYRLPTDAEWSTAVGLTNENGSTPEMRDGVIRNQFPWGKQWPPPSGAGNYADKSARRRGGSVIENYSDNFPQTSPAGSFKPNALGICDLGGNVWEWCEDGYKGGSRDWGVLRGGSWATSSRTELQSSYRNVVDRTERDVIFGFRCVLAQDSSKE